MIEVYKILRGFEGTEEVKLVKRRVEATRAQILNCSRSEFGPLSHGKYGI